MIADWFESLYNSTIGALITWVISIKDDLASWMMSQKVEIDPHLILGVMATMLLVNLVLFIYHLRKRPASSAVWKALPLNRQMTLVHEGGHMLSAFSVLSKVKGIAVNKDGSGHTVTISRGGVLRKLWTTFWGYPAPVVTGALITWMIYFGWVSFANIFVTLSIACYLLLSRSLYALRTVVILALFIVAIPATLSYFGLSEVWNAVAVVLTAYAWILLSAGIVKFWQMYGVHIKGDPQEVQSSDAYTMQKDTGIHGFIWVTIMLAVAVSLALLPILIGAVSPV